MQHFDWKHVALITQEEDIFILVNIVCNGLHTSQLAMSIQNVTMETMTGEFGALSILSNKI